MRGAGENAAEHVCALIDGRGEQAEQLQADQVKQRSTQVHARSGSQGVA